MIRVCSETMTFTDRPFSIQRRLSQQGDELCYFHGTWAFSTCLQSKIQRSTLKNQKAACFRCHHINQCGGYQILCQAINIVEVVSKDFIARSGFPVDRGVKKGELGSIHNTLTMVEPGWVSFWTDLFRYWFVLLGATAQIVCLASSEMPVLSIVL